MNRDEFCFHILYSKKEKSEKLKCSEAFLEICLLFVGQNKIKERKQKVGEN